MRIKLDEDLPNAAAQSLRKSGYDVATARDQGLGGYSDSELWAAVQKEQRFLITADKGFAERGVSTHLGTTPVCCCSGPQRMESVLSLSSWIRCCADTGSRS